MALTGVASLTMWDNMMSSSNRFWSAAEEVYSASYAEDCNASVGFKSGGEQRREYGPKHDKSLPTPDDVATLTGPTERLTDCVKNYLSKFFDRGVLNQIAIRRNYLPPIALDDARAFTPTGDQIFFNT